MKKIMTTMIVRMMIKDNGGHTPNLVQNCKSTAVVLEKQKHRNQELPQKAKRGKLITITNSPLRRWHETEG